MQYRIDKNFLSRYVVVKSLDLVQYRRWSPQSSSLILLPVHRPRDKLEPINSACMFAVNDSFVFLFFRLQDGYYKPKGISGFRGDLSKAQVLSFKSFPFHSDGEAITKKSTSMPSLSPYLNLHSKVGNVAPLYSIFRTKVGQE